MNPEGLKITTINIDGKDCLSYNIDCHVSVFCFSCGMNIGPARNNAHLKELCALFNVKRVKTMHDGDHWLCKPCRNMYRQKSELK